MKKLINLLAVVAMVFCLSGKAQAVPYYYTFDGSVTTVNDGAGAIASQFGLGFGVGSAVTYTFIIDLAVSGSYTLNDGTVVNVTDLVSVDYFYADYISGDALSQVGGGYYNDPFYTAENNFGVNYLTASYGDYLYGNSTDDPLQIRANSAADDVSNWAVGTQLNSINTAVASDGSWSDLYASLTLTDVSPVNAVPEPSTLILLGSGMLGLLAFRRRAQSAA